MPRHQPHDTLFRFVFSDLAQARDHFRAHLPPDVVAAVRWDTLRGEPASVADPALRQTHGDLVFSARLVGRGRALLFLLFEHQSTSPAWMALRVLAYVARVLADWARKHPAASIPIALPVVLYTGARPWTAKRSVGELYSAAHRARFGGLLPELRYEVHDLSGIPDEALRGEALRRLALLLMKHTRSPDFWSRFPAWLDAVAQVARAPDGGRALHALLRYISETTSAPAPADVVESIRTVLPAERQEDFMTWADQLRGEGRDEGRMEGRQEGRLDGQRALTTRLLEMRFAPLPDAVRERIAAATEDEIERWSARLLSATTLDAVWSGGGTEER